MSPWPVLLAAAGALTLYALVYWLGWDVAYRLSPRVLRRAHAGMGRVALTFDDGPGEATAAVLDRLAELGVAATFFVVGGRAARAPELLARMRREGHDVALHGARHVHAALIAPWRAAAELEGAARALRRATDDRCLRLMRPPWGSMSAALATAARRAGFEVALWSLDGRDYRVDMTAEAIARRVADEARDGDIVDLHDAGGAPGAPERTLAALGPMVEGLRARGLEPVTLTRLLEAGREERGLTLGLWELWEHLFAQVEKATPIGDQGLIVISLRPYRGPVLSAPDGRRIAPGALAGEIHLGNMAVSRLAGGPRETFRLRRLLNGSVDALAAMVAAGGFPGVEVFFGTTLLGRAAAQVGLHAEAVRPTVGVRLNAAYMRLLMRIYHPEGAARLRRHPEGLAPMLCWVTRDELVARAAQVRSRSLSRPTAAR